MKFIQGNDRTQTHLFPVSMDHAIDPDNEVRLIDLFVDSLPLAEADGEKRDQIRREIDTNEQRKDKYRQIEQQI